MSISNVFTEFLQTIQTVSFQPNGSESKALSSNSGVDISNFNFLPVYGALHPTALSSQLLILQSELVLVKKVAELNPTLL